MGFPVEQIADAQTEIHAHFPDVGIDFPELAME
jgi:hypothetical protein